MCSSWQSFLQERPYATAYWPFSVMESCTSNANPLLDKNKDKMENGKAETKRRKLPQLPSVLLNKIIIDIVMYSNASKVPNLFFKKDIYYLLLSYKHIEKFISRRCSIRYMC